MRELLVLGGLIALGYFAESAAGYVLSESCRLYEKAAYQGFPGANPTAATAAVSRLELPSANLDRINPTFWQPVHCVYPGGTPESSEADGRWSRPVDFHEVRISQLSAEAGF